MILIIDYDMGNIASIKNMLHRVGCDDVMISGDRADFPMADKFILPGVGAFDQGVKNLKDKGLFDAVAEYALEKKKPVMGICLGMQLLGNKSEEGTMSGLGLIPFDTVRFDLGSEYKVPHMGWDEVNIIKKESPIVAGTDEETQRYYFVHSFHAKCEDESNMLMTCNYGYEFPAAVIKDNVYGFQFHPEKSHRFGMKLFENFVSI